MGFHTFPIDRADALEDPSRYRFCSREELLAMLDPDPDDVVTDLGSGTGFYADDVAPFVGTLRCVDVQEAMHDLYREKGAPENVEFVTAEVSSLPFDDDSLDAAYSTMTHHEYAGVEPHSSEHESGEAAGVEPHSSERASDEGASGDSFAELARVLRPGGRLVTVDWSADGSGESGPPTDERFSLAEAIEQVESAGFEVELATDRPETFALVATA